ncbi:MAG: hypothetical protein M0R46_10645 [Candidatus Muirbacterium halophilum]|nr:hypothetical protein [Candidatus Muirbacterium halophilum]
MLDFILDNEVVLSAYKYDIYNNMGNDDRNMLEIRLLPHMNNTLINKLFSKNLKNLAITYKYNTFFFEKCYVEGQFYYEVQDTSIVLKIYYYYNDLKLLSIDKDFTYKQIIRNNKIKNLLEE